MSTVMLSCGLCQESAALDRPATGAIPPCPSCGGVLSLRNPVIFACTACGARSQPTTADPHQARACPRCKATLVLAPPSAVAATIRTPVPTVATPELPSHATLVVGEAPMAMGLTSGGSFGRYRIEKELARGGMGIVYVAVDPQLKRKVALKVMIAGDLAGTDAIRRFVREARSAGQLKHPHIIAVHDAGEIDGRHFFTMDLIKGVELGTVIGGEKTLNELIELMIPVCDALHHAHEHGIVHRDLKPANVMIDERGRPIVMDFGLAKDVSGEASFRSLSGIVQGTPAYMAPEQARGETKSIDRRTDVYALGVMLYELSTGRRPFAGDTLLDTIRAVVSEEPIEPARLAAEVDPGMNAVILRCLEKDPAKRYATADELKADLEHWLAGEAVSAKAIAAPMRAWRRLRTKPRLLAGLVAGLGVFVIAGLSLAYLATREDWLERAAREVASGTPERMEAAVAAVAAPLAKGEVASGDRNRALAVLHAALAGSDGRAWSAAALALATAGDVSAGPALIKIAADLATEDDLHAAAVSALFTLGSAATDAESGARTLSSTCAAAQPDQATRLVAAILAMDRAGGADALTSVAVDNAVPSATRVAIINALGAGDPTMVGPAMARLVRLSGDPDALIGAAASRALERLRSTQAVFNVYGLGSRAGNAMAAAGKAAEAIAAQQRELEAEGERQDRATSSAPIPAVVIAERLSATDPDVRATAAYDLGRIGEAAAVPYLTKALTDADGGVRRTAGRSLVALAATTPVNSAPIAALLSAQDPAIRSDAARCLGELEASEATAALATALGKERDARAKIVLIEALGRIHDPAGLPALRAVLADKTASPELTTTTVIALGAGKAHAQAALPDLVGALRHSARSAREAAAKALADATGTDLGNDPERWKAWLAKHPQ